MPSAWDNNFSTVHSQLHIDNFGEDVTYRAAGSAATSSIKAKTEHLPDLSPVTALPHHRRKFTFRVTDLPAGEPQRGSKITDENGDIWTIFDQLKSVMGLITVFARIGQTRT